MPSTYTSRLRFTLPATGELTNVWGNTVNSGITELVESSIAGAATLSTWGGAGVAYTLSNNNGVADEARCMFLVASGTPGENKNIICPAVTKLYVVRNNVSGGFSVTLKTSAGTGITVPNGTTMFLRCDGTDVVDALTRVGNFQAATLGVSGDLTFSGTAQRILGDFTNATVADRLAFQTSTVNGNSSLAVLPNGTSNTAQVVAYDNSDPTNASMVNISIVGASDARLQAARTGTGTHLPLTIYTFGSEKLRIAADATGTYTFGGTAPRITGDFSNATIASRVMVQTSTVNGSTTLSAIPNGTGTSGIFLGWNSSDVTNGAWFGLLALSTEARLQASKTGTGSYLPITFLTNDVEQLRILTTGGITSASLADAVGYKGTPLNEQSTAYTLVIGDQGKSIVHPISDNNARTFTIPANGSVAYPVGTTVTFINMINTVTIAITTDTMYLAGAGTTGSRTLAAYGMATAVKMTSTSWIISGNGLS